MAFKREVRLVIAPPGTDEGIVISDLDMEFRATRSTTVAENVAEFVIYGANESTRNDILIEGASIEFSAAYADAGGVANNGPIFRGNVINVVPQKLPTTWQVNLHVSNIKKGTLSQTQVSLSYAPDTPVGHVINDLAALLNMVVYGLANADGITLPNGLAECTTARNALMYLDQILRQNGKGIYRDLDEIVIFSQGEASFFDIVKMTFETGLISVEEYRVNITKKKSKRKTSKKKVIQANQIQFSTQLFPQIRPNGLLEIADVSEKLNGRYSPTIVEYVGDNMSGPFNCNGRADKLEAPA